MAQSGQPAARYSGVPLGIHFVSRSEGVSIHTSLHVGQSFRISRCASTPRSAAAILYASTPMSTSRVTALAASLVCRVESTRWPVRDACTAICAVSASRISPTSSTFGSCRRIERSADANVRPAFSCVCTCTIPAMRYSTGSSTVTMFTPSPLIWLMQE